MQYGFQSILQPDEPWSVSEVTARIKDVLESDDALADVRVAGEISNLSRPASGHLYFTFVYKALSAMTTGYVSKEDAAIEHPKWVEKIEHQQAGSD